MAGGALLHIFCFFYRKKNKKRGWWSWRYSAYFTTGFSPHGTPDEGGRGPRPRRCRPALWLLPPQWGAAPFPQIPEIWQWPIRRSKRHEQPLEFCGSFSTSLPLACTRNNRTRRQSQPCPLNVFHPTLLSRYVSRFLPSLHCRTHGLGNPRLGKPPYSPFTV